VFRKDQVYRPTKRRVDGKCKSLNLIVLQRRLSNGGPLGVTGLPKYSQLANYAGNRDICVPGNVKPGLGTIGRENRDVPG
jgi:hypothetical protein